MLEILLTQLRQSTISCSFVHVIVTSQRNRALLTDNINIESKVGSPICHPSSSQGYLPNKDFMEFLSSTTFGACLSGAPEVDSDYEYRMNVYHEQFLTWGFHKSYYWSTQSVRMKSSNGKNEINDVASIILQVRDLNKWALSNPCFAATSIQRVQKKECDYLVNCPLHSVLSCRLREGFTLKEVCS